MQPTKRGLFIALAILNSVCLVGSPPAGAQSWVGSAGVGVQVRGSKGALAGAHVEILYRGPGGETGGPAPRATNPQGQASFTGIAEGVWSLEVTHPDHLSYVATLSVRRGKKTEVVTSFLEASGPGRNPIRVKVVSGGGKALGTPLQVARAEPAAPPETTKPVPLPPPPPAQPEPRQAPPPVPEDLPEPMPEPTESKPIEEGRPADVPETPAAEAPVDEPAETPADPTPSTAPEPAAVQPRLPDDPGATVEPPVPPTPEPVAEPKATSEPPPETPRGSETPIAAAPPAAPPQPADTVEPQKPPAQTPAPAPPAEPPRPRAEPVSEPEPPVAEPQAPTPPPAPTPETTEIPSPPEETPLPEPEAAAPAPEPPPALSGADASVRSFRDRTCFDCKPGEWAVGSSAELPPATSGGCPAGALESAEEGVELLAARLGVALGSYGGSALGAEVLDRLDAGSRDALEKGIGGLLDRKSPCRLLVLSLPAGARMSGFRFEAFEGGQGGDCFGDQPCPVGESRWLASPGIERSSGATLLWAVFENESQDSERLARFVGYFTPPGGWRP